MTATISEPIVIDLTESSPFDMAPSIWDAIGVKVDERTYEERTTLPVIDTMERSIHVEFAALRELSRQARDYAGDDHPGIVALQNRPEAIATLYENGMEGCTFASRWTEF